MKRGALAVGGGPPVLGQVLRAESIWERMRGLLGRAPLGPGQAMLIEPCAAVHTFGMRYALDLAFLDRDWRILQLVERLAPWRTAACARARATLEMAGGEARRCGLRPGQQLRWLKAP